MSSKDTKTIHRLLPERELDHFSPEAEARDNMACEAEAKKLTAIEVAQLRRQKAKETAESKVATANELRQAKEQAMLVAREDARYNPRANIITINSEAGMVGTTRPEVTKLLKSLNVNLDVQLTRSDTQNLLATLLTCNEKQLQGLQANPKVPIAIKIVIKRLLDDAIVGDMSAIERVWDRVFGKNALAVEPSQAQDLFGGLIPNTPVSREAYIVIKQHLTGTRQVEDIQSEEIN